MSRKLAIFAVLFILFCLVALPVAAQTDSATGDSSNAIAWLSVGMAIAAAGCGIAQSNAIRGSAEGVARNPGAADNIRLFLFLGLALIEFLALLTFVVCYLVLNGYGLV